MKFRFWGTRGSVPAPGKDTITYGGNTSCVEFIFESNSRIIIDSGTGIRALGEEMLEKEEPVDIHLLITHIHWDHVLGFPFFGPIHDPNSRINVDGFPACMKGLKTPFDTKMGFFPVKAEDLKADIHYLGILKHKPLEIDGVLIDTIPLQHPQGGMGFRFNDGEKKIVFLTDNEFRAEMTGGRRAEEFIDFCKECDILIHDAQYTPDEIKDRRGWGHTDYLSTLHLAIEASAKKLILFHHDPSRKDSAVASIVEHCRDLAAEKNTDIIIEAAREDRAFIQV